MNFFKLYIGDYQRDTAHLSVTEHGAYLLMLQHYYATEKPLPTGKALHRMLRADNKQEREAIEEVAARFWTLTPDGLVNDRAAEEIGKADHQRTVNREIGKRGGRPKQTESKTESVTEPETEQEPIDNPNQTPDTRHQKTLSTNPTPSIGPSEAKKREVGVAKGSRLSPDWKPDDELRMWSATKRPDLDLDETLERFRDFWTAKAGADARKSDWPATWRQWVRNEKPPRANGNGASLFDDWDRSDAGIVRKGNELRMQARPGESMRSFKERINETLRSTNARH